MRNRWLLCVLLSTLSWGQAAPATPPPAQTLAPSAPATGQQPARATVKPPVPAAASEASAIPPTAAVLTVKGVCPTQPQAPAAKGTAAKPASAAKTPAGDCKTVITKADFDTLLKAIPNGATNPQVKRNVSGTMPRIIAMSAEAQKKGLDKTPEFKELMKFVKMQVLANQLQQKIQEDALKLSDQEILKYYKDHQETYEQYSLERLFVPRTKQVQAEPKEKEEEGKKEEKLTDEQEKAKQAEEKAKQEENAEAMTKLADTLRSRAVAGEDFAALQKEAFDAAGMKIQSPTVSMPNQRRTNLPPAQASVFDLKPGEVSQVISDAGGHYIYKVKSKEQLSLDQVKDEIRRNLQSQYSREAMEKINNSFTVEKNEAYFGPDAPMGPGPRMPVVGGRIAPPPNAPMPQPSAPPAQQAAPPVQPAPPTAKPN